MFHKVFIFLKKPTSKNIIINTIGNYLNIFFVAFFAFILVRIMSPLEYGILSVLLGISYVLANILDFGTTASIYSYLPTIIDKKKEKVYIFLKTVFFYQSLFSFVVIFLFLIIFPYLDRFFFKTNSPFIDVFLTVISVLFFIWQNYIINSLNAAKKFLYANLLLNLSNIIKTFFIFIFYKLNFLTIASVIFIFGILGPSIFFIVLFFDKLTLIKNILKAKIVKEEFRFRYTISFFIASQFFNLALRIDLFLISFFYPQSPQIGYYGLAQKIILTILAAIGAITQVLSPNFAKTKSKTELRKEIVHGFFYLLIPVIIFIVLYFTPNSIFDLFFTEKYHQAIMITRSLVFPFILYTFSNLPALLILYTSKKTLPILIGNIIFFIITGIGCYLLVPQKGVFAPSEVFTIGFAVLLAILSLSAYIDYKKSPQLSK